MCGIVALFSRGGAVSAAALHRATLALQHRGPDGVGEWVSSNGHVGFGHTRLSISTPAGKQPIASEDEQCHIMVNGEFYDYEIIRRRLEAKHHRFRTNTDSEIALHLYEDLGSACLEHLRGEFAFILWNEAEKTLFAARDRFGIKPLFYTQVGDVLYLASEAKALFATGARAAWDDEAVFQTMFGCYSLDRSLFHNIRQVPPGHFLLATPASTRLVCYWDIPYPPRGERAEHVSEQEWVEQVRHLLAESVHLRMQAAVPVGCMVSGGLDSSSVLGLAATYSQRPVTAFTIAFNHQEYDESSQAQAMAQHVGADLKVIPISETDLADHLADSAWHGEMIQYNGHGTARFLLSRAIQQHGYRAVLAGEGADELFAGYGFVRAAVLRHRSTGIMPQWLKLAYRLLRPMSQTERLVARTSPWLARISRLVELPPALIATLAEGLAVLGSVLSPDFVAQFHRRDPYREFFRGFDIRAKLWGREPAKQILYLWLRSIFVNYHLATDRLDMAHAVEVRLPFLDHKLFEYACQIPVSLLAKGGQQKYVLREAARPFVTESVYRGRKQPFWAPPATLRPGNALYELTQETLRGPAMSTVPFFNQAAVVALLDKLPTFDTATRTALDPLLMMMLSLCILHQRFRL
jgi:asparagine synthase (glutamine-hydrolysing)